MIGRRAFLMGAGAALVAPSAGIVKALSPAPEIEFLEAMNQQLMSTILYGVPGECRWVRWYFEDGELRAEGLRDDEVYLELDDPCTC